MPSYSAKIANEFIKRAAKEGRLLTHMQLQKLVYISHGWNLAINEQPLTTDDPQAWDYGPVYTDLFDALKTYGNHPVTKEIRAGDFGTRALLEEDEAEEILRANLHLNEIAVIDRVFRDYGKFHAFKLSALTHQTGTPWDQVYNNGLGKGAVIDDARIQRYFVDLAKESRIAV